MIAQTIAGGLALLFGAGAVLEPLTDVERAFVDRTVDDCKRIQDVVREGDLLRLSGENVRIAFMYASRDRTRAVVFACGRAQNGTAVSLHLQNLEPSVCYRVRELGVSPKAPRHTTADGSVVTGAALLSDGLPLTLEGDSDSAAIEVVAAPKVAPSVTFEVLERRVIREDLECLNFCFANHFGGGRVSLCHSIGIHQETERGSRMRSEDCGKTWTVDNSGTFPAMNSFVTRDGRRRCVEAWESKASCEHEITVLTEVAPGRIESRKQRLTFPCKTGLCLHREAVRLKSGKLIQSAYGKFRDEEQLDSLFLVSDDDGETWRYLSHLPFEHTAKEGLNECCIVELRTGRLLAMARTGGIGWGDARRGVIAPLVQFASDDGGLTWRNRREISDYGVAPIARILSDGSLVVVTGRPGVFLLFDPTGTGDCYRRVDVYNQPGSAYSSLFEFSPGELTLIYDESQFCSYKIASPTNRIVQLTARYEPTQTIQKKDTE